MAHAMPNEKISSEVKLAAALAVVSITTVVTFIGGVYLLLGKAESAASGLIQQGQTAGQQLITDCNTKIIAGAKDAGTELIKDAGNTVDHHSQVLLAAVDQRVVGLSNAINPVTQAQAMGNKVTTFLSKALQKISDGLVSNTGVDAAVSPKKVQLTSGLQKALQDLNTTGDPNAALNHFQQSEIDLLTDYLVVSRNPSSTGSAGAPSVMEPFVNCFDFYFVSEIVLVILIFGLLIYYYKKQ